MVSIEWCASQKNGLVLVEPNENMSDSYLSMAEESIRALNAVKDSRMWSAVTAYYVFYQSLYSLMLRLGVKCEIHSCSLRFMEVFLDVYSEEDVVMIKKAFKARNDLQYYSDRPVDEISIVEIGKYCKQFYVKTKDILVTLSDDEVENIRSSLLSNLKR